MKLLIVESPGKIKKLQSFLDQDWRVAASVGHIRDLPDQDYGLIPPAFKPNYVVSKPDVVNRLQSLIQQADEVYLASDPDREGEAIAWHLKDVFGLSSYKRVTYTAITKADVEAGIANPRELDMALVHAQEARRALDRLVGYTVSGPLCRAVAENKMSAGRVQSPAVRLIVEREREIKAFVSTTHYGVELLFERVENISDGWKAVWLPKEGWLAEDQDYVLDKAVAEKVAAVRTLDVLSFEEKESRAAPPAPFTTSSLQQAASNALKFKPKKTMELAQKLYEAGHITYMRTDSPNLSESAIVEIRAYADAQGLPLPEKPRTWKSKDGAQEAHEAIRPTHIEVEEAGDSADEKALYSLIRIRALASQLADAVFAVRVGRLSADVDGKPAVFEARGRTLLEKGWKEVMASDDSEEKEEEPSNAVPELKSNGQVVALQGLVSTKKTKPKPRFKEATLVREMEKRGIGRPATYAAILENITSRDYLREEKGCLVPTPRGEKLVDALQPCFSFLDLDFTRSMEDALDDVASGKLTYAACLGTMYDKLSSELTVFQEKHVVPCPECGDREQFAHLYSKEKGYNYWRCKACGASFADAQGRPGAKREKPAQTEFPCDTCGKPLNHVKGEKNGRAYDFFSCSNKECGATYDNVDGKPVARKPREVTEHKCAKCGKPLTLYEGVGKQSGKPYKKFNCTGYPKCRQSYWGKEDGTPDFENLPK